MNDKKYVLIVTTEDDRYSKGEASLDFFANAPWEGLLQAVVFGNSMDELLDNDEEIEGQFYQLYSTKTGERIGCGMFDFDGFKEDIEIFESGKFETKEENKMSELKWEDNGCGESILYYDDHIIVATISKIEQGWNLDCEPTGTMGQILDYAGEEIEQAKLDALEQVRIDYDIHFGFCRDVACAADNYLASITAD